LASSTGGALQTTGGVGVAKDLYVGTTATISGISYLNNTTPTLASSTGGALQTTGGVGVAKDLYVGTTATVAGYTKLNGGSTLSATTVTDTLVVTGYTSLNGGATLSAATVTNKLVLNSTASSTSTLTGALQVVGSVGIGGDVFVGGNLTATTIKISGYSSLSGGATISAATVTNTLGVTGFSSLNGGATISAATVTNTLGVTGFSSLNGGATMSAATVTNTLVVNSTATSTSITSGALTVVGGVGIGKDLYVGGVITTFNKNTDGIRIGTNYVSGGNGTGDYGSLGFYGNLGGAYDNKTGEIRSYNDGGFYGSLEFFVRTNGATAVGTDTTRLITISGQNNNVIVYSTVSSISTTSGALQVVGGVGIGKDLYVGGNITATNHYVASGSLVFSGNISAPAWTTSGIRHVSIPATITDTSSTGTVVNAYTNNFGGNTIAASNTVTYTNYATMFVNVPVAGTNVTITNSYSVITAGGILVNSTVSSTSTTTGALQVIGGVGIGAGIYVGGSVTATSFTGLATAGTSATSAASLVGYMGMPQNYQSTGYTVALSDQGKHIYCTGTNFTVTIPANSSVAFPIGATVAVIAGTATTVTIAITTDTMYLGGAGTTGSRTLAPYGMATAVKVTPTSWFINGTGLT
jgi:hypothetical protein